MKVRGKCPHCGTKIETEVDLPTLRQAFERVDRAFDALDRLFDRLLRRT